jgi:hypothetical protein
MASRRIDAPISGDFDEAMAALLTVKPPPSGKKAVARKAKREAAKTAKKIATRKRA